MSDIDEMREAEDVEGLCRIIRQSSFSADRRIAAARALGALYSAEAVEDLARAALQDNNFDVQQAAKDALQQILGNQSELVLNSYRGQFPAPGVRGKADVLSPAGARGPRWQSIQSAQETRDRNELIRILQRAASPLDRAAAAQALGQLFEMEAVEDLAYAALQDEDKTVQQAAQDALHYLLGNRSADALETYRNQFKIAPDDMEEDEDLEEPDEELADEYEPDEEQNTEDAKIHGYTLVLRGERNIAMRIKAIEALSSLSSMSAMAALAETVLWSDTPQVAAAARAALEKNFGEDADNIINSYRDIHPEEEYEYEDDEEEEATDGTDEPTASAAPQYPTTSSSIPAGPPVMQEENASPALLLVLLLVLLIAAAGVVYVLLLK